MTSTTTRPKLARCVAFFVVTCVIPVAARAAGIRIVNSPSVPEGVYREHPLTERPLRRGDYVCVEGWRDAAPEGFRIAAEMKMIPLKWTTGWGLTKRLGGVPGDRVDYVNETVVINGQPLPHSRIRPLGEPFPMVRFPLVLGADEFWIASEVDRGFDSRYVGAFNRTVLPCRAELLWRW